MRIYKYIHSIDTERLVDGTYNDGQLINNLINYNNEIIIIKLFFFVCFVAGNYTIISVDLH